MSDIKTRDYYYFQSQFNNNHQIYQLFRQKHYPPIIFIKLITTSSFLYIQILQYLQEMDLVLWLVLFVIPPIGILMLILNIKKKFNRNNRRKWAFFHPFCNDGGGGEKVLWCMVKQLSMRTADQIIIYSLQSNKQAIIQKVKSRFNIPLSQNRFQIVYVPGKALLTSKGFLTMVLHIVLPMIYALKCLWKYQPDVFYDTTGYASTLVLVKILLPSTVTSAYVHYPFISEQMIEKVRQHRTDFNNSQLISRSSILSKAKLYYYLIVLKIYQFIGKTVDIAQTNSSWTHNHMSSLWPSLQKKGKLIKLYPPCTVDQLISVKKPKISQRIYMMSLAQFRPEKQQHLQLQILAALLKQNFKREIVLKICGTTRGDDDEAILQNLRNVAKQLNIQKNVEFVVNQPYSKILQCLQTSWLGIHTMEAQHFGISVVEMLAAGLIVVAHSSAGPKFDIIKDEEYLAETKDDYIVKFRSILQKNETQLQKISDNNRKKSLSFGQKQFQNQFMQSIENINKKDD